MDLWTVTNLRTGHGFEAVHRSESYIYFIYRQLSIGKNNKTFILSHYFRPFKCESKSPSLIRWFLKKVHLRLYIDMDKWRKKTYFLSETYNTCIICLCSYLDVFVYFLKIKLHISAFLNFDQVCYWNLGSLNSNFICKFMLNYSHL